MHQVLDLLIQQTLNMEKLVNNPRYIDIYYKNIIFGIGPIKFNPVFLTLLIIFLTSNKKLMDKMFPEK